jgi:hypothetical protein
MAFNKSKHTSEEYAFEDVEFLERLFLTEHDRDGRYKGCKIKAMQLLKWLTDEGFRRFNDTKQSFKIVQESNNILTEYQLNDLKPYILKKLESIHLEAYSEAKLSKEGALEKAINSLPTHVAIDKLCHLPALDKSKIVIDTKETAYFFYLNKYCTVDKDGINFLDYKTLSGVIWNYQIMQRNIEEIPLKDLWKFEFWQFLSQLAGNTFDVKSQTYKDPSASNQKRFEALCSNIGYMCHRYYKGENKAFVLLDARMDDEPNGRSGKSLIGKALKYFLNPLEEGIQH